MKKEPKPYPLFEEENNDALILQEPVATYVAEAPAMPETVAYAHVENDVLQVTPDIEDEIAAVDRGETVSMDEFKTIFSRWL